MVHSSYFSFVEFNCEYKSPSSTYFSPTLSYTCMYKTGNHTVFQIYVHVLSLKRIWKDLEKRKIIIKLN